MDALIVLTPPRVEGHSGPGERISIFPGSATPSLYPACTPFWIGYGFAAGPAGTREVEPLGENTRFELELDGEPVPLSTHVELDGDVVVSKLEIASFPSGLGPGWHRFLGKWFDAGALVLTSDRSIEFVERD